MKKNYKVIFEVTPTGWFGLPDNSKIVLPMGGFDLKQLIQSKSDIWFKVSNYRKLEEAVNQKLFSSQFSFEINENYLILYIKDDSLKNALAIQKN